MSILFANKYDSSIHFMPVLPISCHFSQQKQLSKMTKFPKEPETKVRASSSRDLKCKINFLRAIKNCLVFQSHSEQSMQSLLFLQYHKNIKKPTITVFKPYFFIKAEFQVLEQNFQFLRAENRVCSSRKIRAL